MTRKLFFGTDFRTNTAFLHVSDRGKGRQEEEKGEEEEREEEKKERESFFLLSVVQFSTDLRKKYRRLRARRSPLQKWQTKLIQKTIRFSKTRRRKKTLLCQPADVAGDAERS